jgi:hypothetical protein
MRSKEHIMGKTLDNGHTNFKGQQTQFKQLT